MQNYLEIQVTIQNNKILIQSGTCYHFTKCNLLQSQHYRYGAN